MKALNELKIAIASDHAGYGLKTGITPWLADHIAVLHDFGTYSPDSCDYSDFGHKLADAVEKGEYDYGIAICGSGNGINMTVNKHQGIRAALCWSPELAALARQHNNANILSLPGRFVKADEALNMVKIFLTTDFEGGRHQRRIDKIPLQPK
ncbi:ribose 5-phosphate isomerase B [Microbacter margulisiae]|uniref:Ribose 5-phosphate isomerase B n=1 Tax=Microbacter margulisiae TaxID=1350067 RepID=A0A7W5DQ42_9PORP|nr:ribose 5-phosphate isomerase B [Microbacter margulisiae]MBB3186922.1 ribose 5-phosphate isomerase B [Microbacter margulisiae]